MTKFFLLRNCHFLKKQQEIWWHFYPDAKYEVQQRKNFPCVKIITIAILMLFPLCFYKLFTCFLHYHGGKRWVGMSSPMQYRGLFALRKKMFWKYPPVYHPDLSSLTPKYTANWLLRILRASHKNPGYLASRCRNDTYLSGYRLPTCLIAYDRLGLFIVSLS